MDKDYVLKKIKELIDECKTVPRGVLYTKLKIAVQQDLSQVMGELYKEKRITYNKTLNDILINVNE